MAKDPAFLFYTGDFSTGTQFFTDEQLGKYLRLLMAQHQLGHLQEKHMMLICKSYDKDIFDKFKKDGEGLYYNERLQEEIIKRKNYSSSRSNNKKGKKHTTKQQKEKKSYENHMENDNEIEGDHINNNKESKKNYDISKVDFNFQEPITMWLDYKKERGENYKSQKSLNVCVERLKELAGNNPDVAIKIIKHSISNNYAGLFKEKGSGEKEKKSNLETNLELLKRL